MTTSGTTRSSVALLESLVFKLSDLFDEVRFDGEFEHTQFSNTSIPDSICCVAREQFLHQANENPSISCVVVSSDLASKVVAGKGVVVAEQAEQVFYALHNRLFLHHGMVSKMRCGRGGAVSIHPSAIVSEKTWIGAGVTIGAGVIVEDWTHIGDDVRIESGAIVGSDGHYFKNFDGSLFRVIHAGGVWLDRGVQVLAGAVVSKALHPGFTRIGQDTVVSVKAHVGHGCVVGARCTLTGNVQIAGFSTLGDDVWVGPSATIGNLLTVGDRARIEVGSVVIQDVPADGRVSGNFAYSHGKHLRSYLSKTRY